MDLCIEGEGIWYVHVFIITNLTQATSHISTR